MTIASLTANEPVRMAKPCARAASDTERLRSMLDAHIDFIWRSLRRLGVRQADLADAAQQVFLVASNKLDEIREGSERSFLFQSALRIASNIRRTERRRREISDDWLSEASDGACAPDDCAEERYRRRLLDRALDAMPLDLRSAFVLVDIEELTMADAATLLMVPTGTVASRLRRARIRFRREVKLLRRMEGI